MTKYILSIDQGTTGTTALLFNSDNFEVVAESSKDYEQIYPTPGWVEHNLNTIWKTVETTVDDVIKKSNIVPQDIISIGITNQRETTCAFNKNGEPLAHAIVWQDRRTSDFCQKNKDDYEPFAKKTGLPLDSYFSATKMHWLLKNNQQVQDAAKKNDLLFSTIDTFLLYKLTGHTTFKTEPTNASRTLLMDLSTGNWSKDLLSFFSIPTESLPEIQETFSSFGKTKNISFLPDGIPITCLIGDQQSALFGQACIEPGDLKCTYGTGAFLLLQTGSQPTFSKNGLLTTVAYKYKNQIYYALEGSTYIAGAAVQWLRDNLAAFPESKDIENLARSVKNLEEMKYLSFFPFFTGIGSPHWKSEAKAAIIGMTRDTNIAHLSRACLDGIALSINESLKAFEADFKKIEKIKVDGGASQNNFLMEIQASFSKKIIHRPRFVESTALGAAFGAYIGFYNSPVEDVKKFWKLEQEFRPTKDQAQLYFENKQLQWDAWLEKIYLK